VTCGFVVREVPRMAALNAMSCAPVVPRRSLASGRLVM
jgi:hypothetical protein